MTRAAKTEHREPRTVRAFRRDRAFTLIELLVVIAILSLLAALLMPSLRTARRRAMVIGCMSNLRQIGVGLSVYASDHDGRYPPPASQSVAIIYTTEGVPNLSQWDNRQALVDIAGGRAGDLYFCPLYGGARPEDSFVSGPFEKDFFLQGPNDRHWVGYNMFFLVRDTKLSFDWSASGNPDDRPTSELQAGIARAILVSDYAWDDPVGGGDWKRPYYSGHNLTFTPGVTVLEPNGPFMESNALYGDGHVVTRWGECEYYVRRSGPSYFPY